MTEALYALAELLLVNRGALSEAVERRAWDAVRALLERRRSEGALSVGEIDLLRAQSVIVSRETGEPESVAFCRLIEQAHNIRG